MDIPWKIFEGCWHSFHLSCLDVVDTCPFCRKGIEDAIKSLSSVANKSVKPRGNTGSVDSVSSVGMEETAGNENDDDDDDDDDNDDEELLTDGNVDQILQSLTQQIMALPIRTPPVHPLSSSRNHASSSQPEQFQSSSQRRPPHCSTCGHLLQGHQRVTLHGTLSKSCPVCPSRLCSREGHSMPCACHWCSRQSQVNTDQPLSSLLQGPSVVRETHVSPDVTEWLISVSQSTVTLGQMGSNACTIIAVFGAVNFLFPSTSTQWVLP